MNRRRFIFELLHTDAAKLEGDVVLFGHKNPLKEHLEKTQKAKFKVFKVPIYFGIYEGRAEAELLNLKDHNWKRAVAVKYPSRKKIRESLCCKLSDIFNCCFSKFRPKRTVILPFSWRYSENVAICTLYSLLLTESYMSRRYYSDQTTFITIADYNDTNFYHEYIKNNCKKLWESVDVHPYIKSRIKRRVFFKLTSEMKGAFTKMQSTTF